MHLLTYRFNSFVSLKFTVYSSQNGGGELFPYKE
jgi:hypothetical protein